MRAPVTASFVLVVASAVASSGAAHAAGTRAPATAAPAAPAAPAARPGPSLGELPPGVGPRIDLVFVVDSTGSMGGVLDTSKAEMARILAEVRAGDPPPDLRLSIMTYRDKGDAYRVRWLPLTRDLDAAYAYLRGVEAGGGADWPEDVNHALMVAVTEVNWDLDRNTARVVFLIGDAPPHMDYKGDPTWHDAARIARARGIVINTIAVNENPEVEKHWRGIAEATSGDFDRFDARTGVPVTGKLSGSSGTGVGAGARSGLREGLTRDELGPEGGAAGADADGKGAPTRKSKLGDIVIEGAKKAIEGAKTGGAAPPKGKRKKR